MDFLNRPKIKFSRKDPFQPQSQSAPCVDMGGISRGLADPLRPLKSDLCAIRHLEGQTEVCLFQDPPQKE